MKLLNKKHCRPILASLCVVFLLSSCIRSSTKEENKDTTENYLKKIDSIKQEVRLSAELQSVLDKFPAQMEITMALEKAKAGYYFEITNSPGNVARYTTERSKALNLGVYSADLNYSVAFSRTDETNKFVYCTSKLADELGLSGVYDQPTKDKLKKYSNNKDSLMALTSSLSDQTKSFLSENDRNEVAVLIAAGGFAEGIYLASSLGEMAVRDNSKIMGIIVGQKENYENLMQILSVYKNNPEIQPVVEAMEMLKGLWMNSGIDYGKKIPLSKAVEISNLTKRVREILVK